MNQDLQELVNKGDLIDIQNFAITKKREGNLKIAKKAYEEALKIDSLNVDTYYNFGKVCYLLREREQSLINYLIATHLTIQIQKRRYKSEKHKIKIEAMMMGIDPEFFEGVSNIAPDAVFLLLDDNTPRHVGHAVLDWDTGIPSVTGLNSHVEIYASLIQGKKPIASPDKTIEMGFYRTLGLYFLLENLKWNQITINDPINLYEFGRLSYDYATEFFQKAFRTDLFID